MKERSPMKNATLKYSSATFFQNVGIPTFVDEIHGLAHNKVMVIDGQPAIVIRADATGGFMAIYGRSRQDGPAISIGTIDPAKGGGAQIFMWGSQGQKAVNIVAQDRGNVHTW
jgi:hypothetical protein